MQATKNVTSTACGAPIRDHTKIVSHAGVAGGIVALVAFILRMLARLSCCGGIFGADDWTMMLTVVYTISPLLETDFPSQWKLTGSSHSTFCTLSCLYGSPCTWWNHLHLTNNSYSGRFRFRKGYVDPSFRQHHPYSLCEYSTVLAWCTCQGKLSNCTRSTFGMNCSTWVSCRWPKYQSASSTFVSSLTRDSG